MDKFLSSNLQALSISDQIPPKTYSSSNKLEFSNVTNGLWWVRFIPLLNFVSLDTLVYMPTFMFIAFYAYCFLTGNLSVNWPSAEGPTSVSSYKQNSCPVLNLITIQLTFGGRQDLKQQVKKNSAQTITWEKQIYS